MINLISNIVFLIFVIYTITVSFTYYYLIQKYKNEYSESVIDYFINPIHSFYIYIIIIQLNKSENRRKANWLKLLIIAYIYSAYFLMFLLLYSNMILITIYGVLLIINIFQLYQTIKDNKVLMKDIVIIDYLLPFYILTLYIYLNKIYYPENKIFRFKLFLYMFNSIFIVAIVYHLIIVLI